MATGFARQDGHHGVLANYSRGGVHLAHPAESRLREGARSRAHEDVRGKHINDEFQSANEESWKMSNDDLQSLNNELTALNAQLQATAERQHATLRNLQNILDSTEVPTLVLDAGLNVRFFTPAAMSLFTVVASDVGRPLADLSRRFDDDELLPDARAVLGSHPPIRREVRADAGGWYIRAMLPYPGNGSGIEGVVITFVDISEIKTR